MSNPIESYLEKQTADDLAFADQAAAGPTAGSNPVELTEAIVGQVVGLLLERKSHREIKRAVKLPNPKADNALTLSVSYGQIKDIEARLRARQAALQVAAAEEVEAAPVEKVLG